MTRQRLSVLLAGCVALGWPAEARAGDDEEATLTSQPTTGAQLQLGPKDKKAVLGFSRAFGSGLRLDLLASSPLDKETREAALADQSGLKSGFGSTVRVGYDSRRRVLEPSKLTQRFGQMCAEYLAENGGTDCSDKVLANIARSQSRFGIPQLKWNRRFFWAAAVEFSGAYDQVEVVVDDPTSDKQELASTALETGVRVDLWVAPVVGIKLSSGLRQTRKLKPEDREVCTPVGEAPTSTLCSPIKYIDEIPEGTSAGYARLALNLIVRDSGKTRIDDGIVPGIEFRLAGENLGTGAVARMDFIGFMAPVSTAKISAISGIGVRVEIPLEEASDGSYKPGDNSVTPYLSIGTSF